VAAEAEHSTDARPDASQAPHPRTSLRRATAAAPEPRTYQTFYGLDEKPFSLDPDPKFLFHSAAHDGAVQDLLEAIGRRTCIAVVTGETGIGKTMLCRAVVDQLDRRTLTSYLSEPFVSQEDLFETVLVDFGVISPADAARGHRTGTSARALVETLRAFLGSLATLKTSAVIIIDEAHEVPANALDELRRLAMDEGRSGVLQLVLVGRPEFDTALRRELKSLAERVTLHIELDPLLGDELSGYVMHRLRIAGTSPRVEFDGPALTRLLQASDGVPRLVNLICDRALTLGYQRSASVIDRELVETAAEDLDLAPRESPVRNVARLVAGVLAFIFLMLLGAGAAAWVFRDALGRAVVRWESIPQPPPNPAPRVRPPLVPIPPPE
jgi:general secretion pathway protein A